MKDGRIMVAEIGEGFRFSGEPVATLTFYDRKADGVSKGLKRGTIVADTVPELLDSVKALFEQEGSWEAVVESMARARGEAADTSLTSRVRST